ncbi:SnoaL-like domain protein [Aquisphaera giovannonii]|uniref:SnoaL-like domain protein n=1 Tax=Aquisphaera giovannonii TaxID=406548 RepID=A0A5B9W1M9_9BACT|nr:SgcJ/EcaC family oxidoreductase [Aquisphaera giovannonii]QEH34101.1 SnoaL-like domain protein [Aquisphaera giovannonii]
MAESDAEVEVRALFASLLDAWNRRDARAFAAHFRPDGEAIGFDGTAMKGPDQIVASIEPIFAHHLTARYVPIVRSVQSLGDHVAILRAVAGMVPPGQTDIHPAVNAVQSLVATSEGGGWRIALFQNTPAAYHGRPDLVAGLTEELRRALRLQEEGAAGEESGRAAE